MINPIKPYIGMWISLNTTMGVRRSFSRGEKSTLCLSFSGYWRRNAKWRIQKRKMSSVTSTVACSVFLVRKLDTEQMF